MNGSELHELTTALLDNDPMDTYLFLQMVNVVKNTLEGQRPWRQLLKYDDTQIISRYQNEVDLPEDFASFEAYEPIFLLNNNGNKIIPTLVPLAQQKTAQKPNCYIDMVNNKLVFNIEEEGNYTVNMTYAHYSPDITLETAWIFPKTYHPLLSYMVSGMQKGGVDYDDIFARMAPENKAVAEALARTMTFWDDKLQRMENNV